MRPRVWTNRRKWLGNIIPGLFWLPLTGVGIYLLAISEEVFGLGLWFLVAAQVFGWLALNFFGLFENKKIREEMHRRAMAAPSPPGPCVFVGFASPRYHDLLDAHQDVGFLSFGEDELEFIGETQRISLTREQVLEVHFRPNIHSLVGLGRWIAVEGQIDGRPIRLLVEPRERSTMLGNLRLGHWLRDLIDGWRLGKLPPAQEKQGSR